MNTEDEFNKFKKNTWRTAGARFNSYRRFKTKNLMSIFSISMLSIFNIAISLELISPSNPDKATAVAIIVSIFILVVSVLEFAKDYSVKAERFHRNAMDLTDFNKKLQIIKDKPLTADLLNEYSKIKQSCPENHEPYDDALFCSNHPVDFPYTKKCGYKLGVTLTTFMQTYFLYIVLIATPVCIFFFVK